jgi:F0F1-type ATP synthase membrane subunit c/vacuolar-type H+-ATPase subunit K
MFAVVELFSVGRPHSPSVFLLKGSKLLSSGMCGCSAKVTSAVRGNWVAWAIGAMPRQRAARDRLQQAFFITVLHVCRENCVL